VNFESPTFVLIDEKGNRALNEENKAWVINLSFIWIDKPFFVVLTITFKKSIENH
jgi:hypothetical protein